MDPIGPKSFIFLSNIFQNVPLSCGILIFLILFAGFFATSETALSFCNRVRFKVKAENGSRVAKVIVYLLNKFDKSIIVILIGTNIIQIGASTYATLFFCSFFDQGVASIVSTIVMTLLVFLFSETIPKSIAKARPDGIASLIAYPLWLFSILLWPLSFLLNLIVLLIKKVFHIEKSQNQMTEDDFQDIVEDVKEDGEIDSEEGDIIQAAVDFSDITVKRVMVPMNQVTCLNIKNSSKKQILDFMTNTEFTRIPVYEEDKNHIIGVLNCKKYLQRSLDSTNFTLRSLLTPAIYVSEDKKLDDMVDEFQSKQTHIAFVRNKDNSILGMLTMEDVLEELVGEIDEKEPIQPIVNQEVHHE